MEPPRVDLGKTLHRVDQRAGGRSVTTQSPRQQGMGNLEVPRCGALLKFREQQRQCPFYSLSERIHLPPRAFTHNRAVT